MRFAVVHLYFRLPPKHYVIQKRGEKKEVKKNDSTPNNNKSTPSKAANKPSPSAPRHTPPLPRASSHQPNMSSVLSALSTTPKLRQSAGSPGVGKLGKITSRYPDDESSLSESRAPNAPIQPKPSRLVSPHQRSVGASSPQAHINTSISREKGTASARAQAEEAARREAENRARAAQAEKTAQQEAEKRRQAEDEMAKRREEQKAAERQRIAEQRQAEERQRRAEQQRAAEERLAEEKRLMQERLNEDQRRAEAGTVNVEKVTRDVSGGDGGGKSPLKTRREILSSRRDRVRNRRFSAPVSTAPASSADAKSANVSTVNSKTAPPSSAPSVPPLQHKSQPIESPRPQAPSGGPPATASKSAARASARDRYARHKRMMKSQKS